MKEKTVLWILLPLFSLAAAGCRQSPARVEAKIDLPEESARFSPEGEILDRPVQANVYQVLPFDSVPMPLLSAEIVAALASQYQLLDYAQPAAHRLSSALTVEHVDLVKTVRLLLASQHAHPFWLRDQLELYRLMGEDQKTNVRFTGYYSPVLEISEKPDSAYRYPIYSRPREWEGPYPTRREIEAEGALDSLDLIIGWAANKFDVYLMQIQGSGYVEYPDRSISFFSFDGANRHPYRSMEKFLRSWEGPKPQFYSLDGIQSFFDQYPELIDTVLFQNPSYTFFKPARGLPHGAGSVPLTPEISIAVDPRFIPLGGCLLGAVPIYDPRQKKVVGHNYRILLAQDVGGAIKGPGHVDLYMGAGEEAKAKASSLHHYGQLYLILPKR